MQLLVAVAVSVVVAGCGTKKTYDEEKPPVTASESRNENTADQAQKTQAQTAPATTPSETVTSTPVSEPSFTEFVKSNVVTISFHVDATTRLTETLASAPVRPLFIQAGAYTAEQDLVDTAGQKYCAVTPLASVAENTAYEFKADQMIERTLFGDGVLNVTQVGDVISMRCEKNGDVVTLKDIKEIFGSLATFTLVL